MEFVSKITGMKDRVYIEVPKDLRGLVREEFSGEYIKVNIELIVDKVNRPKTVTEDKAEKIIKDTAEGVNKYMSNYNLRKRKK